jgi:hypothetical protein
MFGTLNWVELKWILESGPFGSSGNWIVEFGPFTHCWIGGPLPLQTIDHRNENSLLVPSAVLFTLQVAPPPATGEANLCAIISKSHAGAMPSPPRERQIHGHHHCPIQRGQSLVVLLAVLLSILVRASSSSFVPPRHRHSHLGPIPSTPSSTPSQDVFILHTNHGDPVGQSSQLPYELCLICVCMMPWWNVLFISKLLSIEHLTYCGLKKWLLFE